MTKANTTQLLQVNAMKPDCARSSLIFPKVHYLIILLRVIRAAFLYQQTAILIRILSDCTVRRSNDSQFHLSWFIQFITSAKFNCPSFRYFDVQDFTWHRSFYGEDVAPAGACRRAELLPAPELEPVCCCNWSRSFGMLLASVLKADTGSSSERRLLAPLRSRFVSFNFLLDPLYFFPLIV